MKHGILPITVFLFFILTAIFLVVTITVRHAMKLLPI